MTIDQTKTLQACVIGALCGEMTFPEIVGKLAAIGVDRYHADYCRSEITYYLTEGDSVVVATPHPKHELGDAFDAATVESAVRESQRGEHTYLDFIRKTMAAGCVGYSVQITGRQVQYFGRRGECHTEHFPD